jgi:hypothetical protein
VGDGGVLRGHSERGRMQGCELGEAKLFSAFLSRVREASWAILGLRPQAKLIFSQMVRRSSGYAPGHGPGFPGPRSAPARIWVPLTICILFEVCHNYIDLTDHGACMHFKMGNIL